MSDIAPPAVRPEVGTPAPDFALPTQNDGETVRLSDLRGKIVVLYFYPKDDTPGCTTQACRFRDMATEYTDAGAVVLGVSTDDAASHRKFADKFTLSFPLLADTEKAVSTAYGVWKEKNNYGKKYLGIERTTFVIDRAGNVARVFPRVKVEGHGDAVLEFVRQMGA